MVKLSDRLKCIANMVKPCKCLCDVGTDHAYIPIYLVANNMAETAIASDVRSGPCKIASANIRENNLQDKIQVRLGSGFDTIKDGECDSAVIAGMGANMIADILQDGGSIPKNMSRIVIQPQHAPEYIKEYLYANRYEIEDEALVYDAGKYYTVMAVRYTGISQKVSKINYYLGERLLQNNDKLLKDYLNKEIERLTNILKKADVDEYIWLLKEYKAIRKGML